MDVPARLVRSAIAVLMGALAVGMALYGAVERIRLGSSAATVVGAAHVVLLAGGLVAAAVIVRSEREPATVVGPRHERLPVWGWLAVGIIVAGLTLVIVGGWPLRWDEAVYALEARSWLEGTPDTGYGIHRPLGMPAVGWLVLQLGSEEALLRVTSAMLTLGVLAALGFAFSRWIGQVAAGVALLVLVSAPSWQLVAVEFLNDIPSTGLLVLTMFLLVRGTRADTSRRHWILAAVAAAAAFYMRYGVILALVPIVVAFVLVWPGHVWARRSDALLASGVGALLLVPHAWMAVVETGSPLGILLHAQEATMSQPELPLVTYARWIPTEFAGIVGGLVLTSGIVWWCLNLLPQRQARDDADRVPVRRFMGAVAVGVLLVIGLNADADARFVFLALVLLAGLGAEAVVQLAGVVPGNRWAGVGLASVMLVAAAVANVHETQAHFADLGDSRQIFVEASRAVRQHVDEPCRVAAAHPPQITWYSRCATTPTFSARLPQGTVLLLIERGARQPEGQELEELLAATDARLLERVPPPPDGPRGATLYVTRRSLDS